MSASIFPYVYNNGVKRSKAKRKGKEAKEGKDGGTKSEGMEERREEGCRRRFPPGKMKQDEKQRKGGKRGKGRRNEFKRKQRHGRVEERRKERKGQNEARRNAKQRRQRRKRTAERSQKETATRKD